MLFCAVFSLMFCLKWLSLICSFHLMKRCVSISILFIICCSLCLSLSLSLSISLYPSISLSKSSPRNALNAHLCMGVFVLVFLYCKFFCYKRATFLVKEQQLPLSQSWNVIGKTKSNNFTRSHRDYFAFSLHKYYFLRPYAKYKVYILCRRFVNNSLQISPNISKL